MKSLKCSSCGSSEHFERMLWWNAKVENKPFHGKDAEECSANYMIYAVQEQCESLMKMILKFHEVPANLTLKEQMCYYHLLIKNSFDKDALDE